MYNNNMKNMRIKKGISLTMLSTATGISMGYLSHLESGTRKNPSVEMMDRIAKFLNETVTEVFFK